MMDPDPWNNVILQDGLTVEEVFQILEQTDDCASIDENVEVQDIYIVPPENGEITDEDSADEDNGGLIDNLNRNQLTSQAEIVFSNNARTGDLLDFSGYSNKRKRKWIKGDLVDPVHPEEFENDDLFKAYKNKSITEIFELFIDEKIINILVTETEKYAHSKNEKNFNVSPEEIKVFLGILILSGYNVLPGKKCYWDTKDDMKNLLVSNSMRRDRFIQIAKYFHVADNSTIVPEDKIYKIRPLVQELKQRFALHFIPCEYLDYDESMVKYFGPHPCKQFIRGKPIRFGYKVWCLNTSYGYLVDFEIYQGKNTPGRNKEFDDVFGKSTAPLISFLHNLPEDKKHFPFHIVTDNLFTSLNLLKYLKERGYKGTGTLRKNRVPRDCPLADNNTVKKMNRGSHVQIIEKMDGIYIGKWMDNNVVTIASNAQGTLPTKLVKRYSQKEKKIISVPQPSVINTYNKNMGGTDRMDQDVNQYRISIRSKKWYWPLLSWLLDVAVNNSWLLFKKTGRKMTKLEFRREIVHNYLTRYKVQVKSAGGAVSNCSRSTRVIPDIRYDRRDHLLCETENRKRRRCAYERCTSVVNTMCKKCNVGLCIKCNIVYHSK